MSCQKDTANSQQLPYFCFEELRWKSSSWLWYIFAQSRFQCELFQVDLSSRSAGFILFIFDPFKAKQPPPLYQDIWQVLIRFSARWVSLSSGRDVLIFCRWIIGRRFWKPPNYKLQQRFMTINKHIIYIYIYEILLSFAGGRFTAPAIQNGKMTLSKKARNSKRPFFEARWLVQPGQTLWKQMRLLVRLNWNCSFAAVISVELESSQHWHQKCVHVQGRLSSHPHPNPPHCGHRRTTTISGIYIYIYYVAIYIYI